MGKLSGSPITFWISPGARGDLIIIIDQVYVWYYWKG